MRRLTRKISIYVLIPCTLLRLQRLGLARSHILLSSSTLRVMTRRPRLSEGKQKQLGNPCNDGLWT